MKKKYFITLTILLILITLSPLCAKGAKEASSQSEEPSYATIDTLDMISSFNYAYGYMVAEEYTNSGISLNGGYYLRGLYDGANYFNGGSTLIDVQNDLNNMINNYVENYYNKGIKDGVGKLYSKDELLSLSSPQTDFEKFSYSYALASIVNDIASGVEIDAFPLIQGAAEYLYKTENTTMNEEERSSAFNTYRNYFNQKMMEEYMNMVSELQVKNLEKAENFLKENASRDGVITLSDGLQIEYLEKSGEEKKPSLPCDVNVDYILEDISGNVYDQNEGIDFSLGVGALIKGFEDGLSDMSLGDKAKIYIHPSLGYGENGSGQIEPNMLLIFTVTLNEIK